MSQYFSFSLIMQYCFTQNSMGEGFGKKSIEQNVFLVFTIMNS